MCIHVSMHTGNQTQIFRNQNCCQLIQKQLRNTSQQTTTQVKAGGEKQNKTTNNKHTPKKTQTHPTPTGCSFHTSFQINTCNKTDRLPRRWSLDRKSDYKSQFAVIDYSILFLQFYITAEPDCSRSLNKKWSGKKRKKLPSSMQVFVALFF